MEAVVVSFYCL